MEPAFFAHFYTALVLADALLVLVALRHSGAYHLIFRNSGLAAATVVLRVALTAPPPGAPRWAWLWGSSPWP